MTDKTDEEHDQGIIERAFRTIRIKFDEAYTQYKESIPDSKMKDNVIYEIRETYARLTVIEQLMRLERKTRPEKSDD